MFGSKLSRGIRPNIKTPRLKTNDSGIVQNKPETSLDDSMAVLIENMHHTDGDWSADNAGYVVLNENKTPYEGGASIDGMIGYNDNLGTDRLYFAANGKLKEADLVIGDSVDIDGTAGYMPGVPVEMSIYQTGATPFLYSVDGTINTPRKWDGVTAGNAGGWPVSDGVNDFSKPKLIGTYQKRLVTGNFPGFPSHLIMSDYESPDSYTVPAVVGTDAYITQIGNEAGQELRAIRSLPIPRSNQEMLVCCKDNAVYLLTGLSSVLEDGEVFNPILISDEFGAFNSRCLLRYGFDVYAFNENGILSYTTASQSGDIQPLGINSDLVKDTIDSLNLSAKDKCWAVHLADRREMWFAMPTGSSVQVDTILVYKYPIPGDPYSKPKWSIRTAAGLFKPSYGVKLKRKFYVGFYNGLIGNMFASSQYDTIGIPWKYKYGKLAYGNEKQFKSIPDAEATFRLRSNQTVIIESKWIGGNNNDYFQNFIPVSTTLSGARWGEFNWGESYWGAVEERIVPFRAPGNGKFNQITLSGTTGLTGPVFGGLTPTVVYGGLARTSN